jgi:uncharacterized membrane protein YesL
MIGSLFSFQFRDGPGVPKDAPPKTGLALFASILGREWWELIKLNLLFLIAALPLITLPAAYVAMTRLCVTMVEDKNHYLLRDFRHTFAIRFADTLLTGIFALIIGALAVFAASFYAKAAQDNLAFAAPLGLAVAVIVLLPIYLSALMLVLVISDLSLKPALKAAAIATLARPLPGLAALAITAALWLIHIAFYPVSLPMPVIMNFSLGTLVMSFAMLPGARTGIEYVGVEAPGNASKRPHP